MFNIAVDGFAGSGKSSTVKFLAKKLGSDFKVLDTGAIFRGIAYAYSKKYNADPTQENVEEFLNGLSISVEFEKDNQHIFVGGKDVTEFIRTPEISSLASKISVFPEIRAKYLIIAQSFAKSNNCVIEGRDIGTIVMPNADVKIFLAADPKVRAKRRYKELKDKDKDITLEKVLEDMKIRDERDQNKGEFSLKPTKESIVVDNSDMTLNETVDYIYNIVVEKMGKKKYVNIAIDGYVCSGKSTIARALAKEIGFSVFDTGAVYRGVACAFDYMKLDQEKISEKYIEKFSKQINISIDFIDGLEHVFVNGIDYTSGLRTEHISALSAKISPFTCIRAKVLKLQRDYAATHNLVMEGRDIGSFVLQDADFKFFCTADENVRAKRRYEQQKAVGNEAVFSQVLKELKERDYADTHREHGALTQVEDSIIVDTTNQSLEESVEFCLKHIRKKYPNLIN